MLKKLFCQFLALIMLLCSLLLTTQTIAAASRIWRCQSGDMYQSWWSSPHRILKNALADAYDQCKKRSRRPHTCHVSPAFCYRAGYQWIPPVTGHWICSAQDSDYNKWRYLAKYRFKAVRYVLETCRANSPFPYSCRIHSCKPQNLSASSQ